MNLLISACLLGSPCRYDGTAKDIPSVQRLLAGHVCFPFCPEQAGGLPTPRPPAELREGRAVTADGRDVTEAYRRGAERGLRLALAHRCRAAVLKERSPSCGAGEVYDGTFSHTLTPGDGFLVRLLRENGIPVYGETELAKLLQEREILEADTPPI